MIAPSVALSAYDIQVVAGSGLTNNSGPTVYTPFGDDSLVGADLIAAQLDAGANVILDTGALGMQPGTIAISSPVVKTVANPASLTLIALQEVTISSQVNLLVGGSVGINAAAILGASIKVGNDIWFTESLAVPAAQALTAQNVTFSGAVTGTGPLDSTATGTVALALATGLTIPLAVHDAALIQLDNSVAAVSLSVAVDGTGVTSANPGSWFGTGGSLTYTNVAEVELTGGSAGDEFLIVPATNTAFRIIGGASGGDILRVDVSNATNPQVSSMNGSGTWTFDDRAPIEFSGIEDTFAIGLPSPTATATASATATPTASETASATATPSASAAAPRENGAPCTADSQCQSAYCSDGVCCNARCQGASEVCDLPGLAGRCAAIEPAPAPAASYETLLASLAIMLLLANFALRSRRS